MRNAADIYRLTAEQLAGAGGLRARSPPQRLVEAIEASQASGRSPACCSRSGIEGVGGVNARNLAQRFRSIDALIGGDARGDRGDAGHRPDRRRDRSTTRCATSAMRELIERLRGAGLQLEQEGPPPGEGPLAGKTFVLTGHAADADPRAGDRAHPRRRRAASPRRCRRRPTTSSPARRPAPSSRRPSGSASQVLDEAGLLALLDRRRWHRRVSATAAIALLGSIVVLGAPGHRRASRRRHRKLPRDGAGRPLRRDSRR